ncbi:hypothetical protein LCGC14_2039550, partial [marine sediment metagenome]
YVAKEYWEELKDHIIKYLNEFKLSKPKKDNGHQSIADMMIDHGLSGGLD